MASQAGDSKGNSWISHYIIALMAAEEYHFSEKYLVGTSIYYQIWYKKLSEYATQQSASNSPRNLHTWKHSFLDNNIKRLLKEG